MRVIAVLVLIFGLIATNCLAAPFLVCDPQAGVLEYNVVIEENGVTVMGGIVPAEVDTTVRFDLEGIPNGVYNAKLKAGNLWGWSDWSLPFGFMVERCNQPTGTLIVP